MSIVNILMSIAILIFHGVNMNGAFPIARPVTEGYLKVAAVVAATNEFAAKFSDEHI